jgi:hypothetical protein
MGIPILFTGCGGPATVPVTGHVAFPDGTALSGGRIEFRSKEINLPAASGVIDQNGDFRLAISTDTDGVVPGEYRAVVVPAIPDESGTASTKRIDPKYMDYKTSDLKFTVSENPEKNDFQIQVTSSRGG